MFRVIAIFSIINFICTANIFAQNMSEYQWKNRLLIIITDDLQQSSYVDQLKELRKNPTGLAERELRVFWTTSNKFKTGIEVNSKWIKSRKLYDQYKKLDTSFEVILIGLDGGIKARKTDVLKIEDLYALIDSMPMRRSEIKNE